MGSEERLPASGGADFESSPGRPLPAFLARLAGWLVILAVIVGLDLDRAVSLMLVALAGVVTIVSDSRFGFERRLEDAGLPSREAWVPLVMLVLMSRLALIQTERIGTVVAEQGPVIVFILAFALVSEGLRRSGFFHFLAYRLAERGGTNTTRLTLYLFLLSSLLTYFTSNDIVILTMTPIVVSVVYQARIRNAKLLLLSQFIAANTVSMGLLIGSPTNLIVGRALGIGFFEYLFLMLVPSVMALMATFVFVTWINAFVERRAATGSRLTRWLVGTWTFSPTYRPPRFSEYRSFTKEMRRWVGVFALAVVLLAGGTATSGRLLAAALLIAAIGATALRRSAREREEPTGFAFAARMLRILPIGIVFFGLTYFVIADAIADAPLVRNQVDEFVSEHASTHSPVPSWSSILVSGVLVNTMNDLPASALAGTVLERAGFATPFDHALVVQGTLTGLNIATYVTPVGALAGIIWFDILHKERDRRRRARDDRGREPFDVVMPSRRDLIVYGSVTFLAMTAIIGATNFGVVALADLLLGPASGGTEFGDAPAHLLWTAGSLALGCAVVVTFRRVLAMRGVALAHLGDLLVMLTRARLWASRHRLTAGSIIAGAIFVGSGMLLYWVESFHAREYGVMPMFQNPGQFMTWLVVFVSSGFENGLFPRSVLGNVLAASLALGSIAALVVLIRLSMGGNDLNLRRKLASGDIPTDRLVIVNCASENLRLIRTLAHGSHRFVTVVTRDHRMARTLELGRNDRVGVIHSDESTSKLVTKLHLEDVREIVLLSRSVSDDFDNLALLSLLEAAARAGSGEPTRRDTPVRGPSAVLMQSQGRELSALIDQRRRDGLLPLEPLPFEAVMRCFLVANAGGRLQDLRRFYAEPLVERAEHGDVDRRIQIRGSRFWLRAHPVPAADDGAPPSPEVVGVQVDIAGRPEWRTFATRFANELPRLVTGRVLISSADADAAPGAWEGHARATVFVVGGDGLAQQCALDLAVSEVTHVRLLVAKDDALLPGVAEAVTVVRCDNERAAAEILAERRPGDEAALVTEGSHDRAFDVERLLEQLSVARLDQAASGHPVPALYVCCRGPERAQQLRTFVVDEVIDSTCVESSYFAVFSNVYFEVMSGDREVADWPADRQLAVAHRVASRLCHLDIWRPGDVSLDHAGPGLKRAPAMTGAAAVQADRAAVATRGPLIGVARFGVEPDDDGEPVVTVDVDIPAKDKPIGPNDLLVGLPYL